MPSESTIFGWIEAVFARGVRRPGYPADEWAEQFCAERFRELGLERVLLEPLTVPRWEPQEWSLEVTGGGTTREVECFPLPHAAPADGLELDLVPWDPAAPAAVAGKASLYPVTL